MRSIYLLVLISVCIVAVAGQFGGYGMRGYGPYGHGHYGGGRPYGMGYNRFGGMRSPYGYGGGMGMNPFQGAMMGAMMGAMRG
ncbi:Neuropeptide-like protein 31 family protein [Oesophagostomum dentatum]|uniref:Neuropeptide-like protein 31 family protein n=1 Tax=Oesophagostomum dentatum TaxID=61180 RepID=A0A0B1SQ05_OESDE|nr:Neuropeptide-like protein 31 family protein [Oesophagostomum dentatum]